MATQLLGPMRGDFWKTRAKPDQISEVRYTVQRPAEKTYRLIRKKNAVTKEKVCRSIRKGALRTFPKAVPVRGGT
jgi:hypothetical protein